MTSSDRGDAAAALLGVAGLELRLDCRRAGVKVAARLMILTDGVSVPGGGAGGAGQSVADAGALAERLAAVLSAVPAGRVVVQLRNRDAGLSSGGLYRLAASLQAVAARHGAPLLVNDRMDVALSVGAAGVHLPGHGLPTRAARRAAVAAGRPELFISVATHTLPEARMASAGGADCVTFGPIWPTPSKPPAPEDPGAPGAAARVVPVGVPALVPLVRGLPIPVFALGGVDTAERAAQCAAAGARVACIRAVLGASDPAAAARALLAAMETGQAPV